MRCLPQRIGRTAVHPYGVKTVLSKASIAQREALYMPSLVCSKGCQPPGLEGAQPFVGVWAPQRHR